MLRWITLRLYGHKVILFCTEVECMGKLRCERVRLNIVFMWRTVPYTAILTMDDQSKVVYDLSNGTIFNDLERPLPTVSRSHHSLTLNISEMVRDTDICVIEILIGTYTRLTQQCHFKWPWVILSDLAKSSMTWSIARSLCDSWASCNRLLHWSKTGRCCLVSTVLHPKKMFQLLLATPRSGRSRSYFDVGNDARYVPLLSVWHFKLQYFWNKGQGDYSAHKSSIIFRWA